MDQNKKPKLLRQNDLDQSRPMPNEPRKSLAFLNLEHKNASPKLAGVQLDSNRYSSTATMPSTEGEDHAADEQTSDWLIPRNDGDVKPVAIISSSSPAAVGVDVDLATAPRGKRRKTTPVAPPEDEEDVGKETAIPSEDSRRLFQKLWTEADEMTILEGFLEFTSQRGTTHADYQHDTGPFYEQIKQRLQLDFSRNQLVEKLRRLKKKYRNMAARVAADEAFVFRSPHDQATFNIAGKIWNPTFKRANRSHGPAAGANERNPPKSLELGLAVPVLDSADCQDGSFNSEDAAKFPPESAPEVALADVKHPPPETSADAADAYRRTPANTSLQSQRSPLPSSTDPPPKVPGQNLAEQIVSNGSFLPLFKDPHQLLCGLSSTAAMAFGERWKQQQILELEVYLKRVELVHEQVKCKLEELRSEQGINS